MITFKKKFGEIHYFEVSRLGVGLAFQVSSIGLGAFDEVSVSKVMSRLRHWLKWSREKHDAQTDNRS